jgi:hypothetical protein
VPVEQGQQDPFTVADLLGEHAAAGATEHVDRATEAMRGANHAAVGPITGPDAYAVVGLLAELVHRLPQLLDYLARGLRRATPPSTTTTAATTAPAPSAKRTAPSLTPAGPGRCPAVQGLPPQEGR